MSEDFDIYADLEHIEGEAKKESQELLALENRIKELEKQVNATEQEKTDIIRRNGILLENVSSLLLTAKAEIKRKDTTISDLRRKCDNVVLGRKSYAVKSVNKFTQTHVVHTLNAGVQTLPIGCIDPLWSNNKYCDVVTDSPQIRDREREGACKGQTAQEGEQNYTRYRAQQINKESDRHRDQERNRDRDRYRDSDRERDRERYGERDRNRYSERCRKRSQERNRHKDHYSYDRSGDKEPHDVARKKYLKHNEERTRNEERNYDAKQTPHHSMAMEVDEYNRNDPRLSENDQKCLETRWESSKAHTRTQEQKDSKKHAKLTHTESNHVSKRMSQNTRAIKIKDLVQDTKERPASKSAISEYDTAEHESFQLTKLIDTNRKGLGIQMTSEIGKQSPDTFASIPHHDRRNNAAKSIDTDCQNDNEAVCRSSKNSSKFLPNLDPSSKAMKKIEQKSKDSRKVEQSYIPQAQDNQNEVSSHYSRTPNSTVSSTFSTGPTVTTSSKNFKSISEADQLDTDSERVEISASTMTIGDTSTMEKQNDETRTNNEHNTFFPGTEIIAGTFTNAPGRLIDSSCYNVEFNLKETRNVPLDKIRHEEIAQNSEKSHSIIEVINVQNNVTNEVERKNDKGKTLSKRKLRPKPVAAVLQNDVSKELKQSELCQTARTDEEVISTIPNSESEGQVSISCQNITANECEASRTKKAQELTYAKMTTNVACAPNAVANETDLMIVHMEPNSELPRLNDVANTMVSDDPTYATAEAVTDAANDKPQSATLINDAISLNDTNSHCFLLRDRRANSCYTDVLQIGEHPPPESMSIQTYFMNFNVQEVENEVISCDLEQSNPAQCVELVNERGPGILNGEGEIIEFADTSNMQTDAINEVPKKPKVSTAEIIRERLRKKNSVTLQKASHVTPFKRRLSIDSAGIASKRCKLDIEASVNENKLSVSPSGKLSSTYFSQIALPITSALDCIPSKHKSPNVKQKAHDMLMTPMVVVHSPAKPSQEPDKSVQNNYYYIPVDNQSSLQNIMDSLLKTPIKNESSDRVSPPCVNGFTADKDNGQNFVSTNSENTICSPLHSTMPVLRFSSDDEPANVLFRESTTVIEEKSTLQTLGQRQTEPFAHLMEDTRLQNDTVSNIEAKGQTVHENTSKQTAYLLGKHGDGNINSTANQSANDDHNNLNVNNNYKISSNKKKIKEMNVAPEACKSTQNENAIIQHPSNTSIHTTPFNPNYNTSSTVKNKRKIKVVKVPDASKSTENKNAIIQHPSNTFNTSPNISSTVKNSKELNVASEASKSPKNDTAIIRPSNNFIPTNVPQSKVVKTSLNVPKSPHQMQLTNINSANINDTTKEKEKVYKSVEKTSSKKVRHKSTANVNAFEKTGLSPIFQSSSKCSTKDELRHATAPLLNNSSSTIFSEKSAESTANMPTASRKRSRKHKNDEEKRTRLLETQAFEKDAVGFKNGTEILNHNEQTQSEAGNNTEVGKVNPQHLEAAQSTVSIDSTDLKRLNPQTQTEPSVPDHIVSPANTSLDKRITEAAERSQCVVSNVTLNLSLADNASNNHISRKHNTPVQHVREMRIVKESPSLMRIFITRK